LARLADALIVHCTSVVSVVSEHLRIAPERLDVVPHGHFAEWYPSAPIRADARNALGLALDQTVVLHFGNIRTYKGVNELVSIFRESPEPGLHLAVVGRPKTEEVGRELRALAEGDDRITLDLGFVKEERLVQYIAASDVVALPYDYSLTSGSAVLAASLGRPIIAPSTGCLVGFPDGGGLFYPLGSREGLRGALEVLRETDLDGMGAVARSYALQFPWSMVGDRTAAIYRRVLGEEGFRAPAADRTADPASDGGAADLVI
jgi:glycosyltransferase involved in cell wall biosynthesis